MPVARIVALLLILLPIGAYFVVSNIAKAGPSPEVVVEATYGWVRREGA